MVRCDAFDKPRASRHLVSKRPPVAHLATPSANFPENVQFPKALMTQAPGIVVEHLSEGLLIVDATSQLIYWNPAALKLFGF
jgi:PAS domain-containing protein